MSLIHYSDQGVQSAALALGLMATITGHMLHMLYDELKGHISVQPLWLSAAVITAIYCIQQKQSTLSSFHFGKKEKFND
jgi:hypothetical protein